MGLRTQQSQPAIGPIVTMAVDNAGGGWAWAGPASPGDNPSLLKLQDGNWQVASDANGALVMRTSPSIYKIAMTGNPGEGWAIANQHGGAPYIWRIKGGVWSRGTSNVPSNALLDYLTVSADGTDGWIVAEDSNPALHTSALAKRRVGVSRNLRALN